jgi:hypothetical protein
MVVEITDKETGELYYRDWATNQFKTTYSDNYGMVVPSTWYYFTETTWDGTDLDGNDLPSGTQCVCTITAYNDGDYPTTTDIDGASITDAEKIYTGSTDQPTFNGHAMDMTGDVLTFDITVDSAAPELTDDEVTISKDDSDGKTYMEGTFTDYDGTLAYVGVVPIVNIVDKTTGEVALANQAWFDDEFYGNYIYDDTTHEVTFKADVTEYVHNESKYDPYYNFEWTGYVYVIGGDYAGNESDYLVEVVLEEEDETPTDPTPSNPTPSNPTPSNPVVTDPTQPTDPTPTDPEPSPEDTEENGAWINPYNDIKEGTWYYDAVKFVSQNGYLSGDGSGSFMLGTNLTRGMIAQIIYNMEGKPAATTSSHFSDVADGRWYSDAVNWAAANKIVSGYGDGTFGPNDDVTREQLVLILQNYAVFKGSEVSTQAELNTFADGAKTSGWAESAVRWAVGAGIVSGKSGNILDPQGTATREEAAQLLMNFCKIVDVNS